ncbi:MAG: hypothetical protein ACRDL0_10565 [Thermoleophilaceae bacterium]
MARFRRSRTRTPLARLAPVVSLLAFLASAPGALAAQQVITSSGPLTNIYLNDNLGCQVQHAADSAPSFFGGTDPGSCGTFLAIPGDPIEQIPPQVYGPNVGPPSVTPFTPVTQSPVSGSGSSADPFTVTTVVDAGSTGLQVTQTDSYVVGEDSYQTEIEVSSVESSQSVVIYHAADCLLGDSDSGHGFFNPSTGGIFCAANPNNSPPARLLGFTPLNRGSNYYEAHFDEVWDAVNGSPFPDICECDLLQDNGAGLSWEAFVFGGPSGAATRSLTTTVTAPTQQPPPPPDTTPPDTPITSGPPASSDDHTPTFTFTSTEAGSTFQCSIDGGPFSACASPFTTSELGPGSHSFAVRAIDPAGNVDPTPTVYNFEVEEFTLRDLPDPERGETVNVQEVRGRVLVGIRNGAGSARTAGARASQKGIDYVPLSEARQIPVGSFLDTRRGTIRLQSARNRAGRRQSGNFVGAIFQIRQSRKRRLKGLTELRLKGASFRRCRRIGRGRRGNRSNVESSRRRRGSRRRIRRIRSRARGRFRTRGRYSSATVRGTVWTTIDRCDGTLTKVRRGRVVVRDFRRKRNITVRAGKRYLARAPR